MFVRFSASLITLGSTEWMLVLWVTLSIYFQIAATLMLFDYRSAYMLTILVNELLLREDLWRLYSDHPPDSKSDVQSLKFLNFIDLSYAILNHIFSWNYEKYLTSCCLTYRFHEPYSLMTSNFDIMASVSTHRNF